MNTIIQEKLIEKIKSIKDTQYLEELLGRVQVEQDTLFRPNEAQKESIALALKEIENGQFISEQEAEKSIDQWFAK